ncbi:hypothetical protein D5278_12675 [bacterium 1XD21-13]|nr:hypothetical protein [bacterium 1XD21-13]
MKQIGKILAGVLVAVLLLTGIKNEYARLLPVSSYGMQAAIKKKSVDHLFIGSSMFRQGLSIDVLEEALKGNVYILSYNGNQPAFMAMELEYMLREGLEIGTLYVDLYPYTAAATPWISDTKILLDTDLGFKLDAWRLMNEYNDTKLLDFYELFVTANNEQILTYPIHNRLVSAQFRSGGNILTPGGQTKEHLDSLGMLGGRDGLQEAQIEGYKKILELAREHGIKVYFIETPKYERMYQDSDYMELYEACRNKVEELTELINSEVILAQELTFDFGDPACFQDLIHLSTEGRTLYTELLCERLEVEE